MPCRDTTHNVPSAPEAIGPTSWGTTMGSRDTPSDPLLTRKTRGPSRTHTVSPGPRASATPQPRSPSAEGSAESRSSTGRTTSAASTWWTAAAAADDEGAPSAVRRQGAHLRDLGLDGQTPCRMAIDAVEATPVGTDPEGPPRVDSQDADGSLRFEAQRQRPPAPGAVGLRIEARHLVACSDPQATIFRGHDRRHSSARRVDERRAPSGGCRRSSRWHPRRRATARRRSRRKAATPCAGSVTDTGSPFASETPQPAPPDGPDSAILGLLQRLQRAVVVLDPLPGPGAIRLEELAPGRPEDTGAQCDRRAGRARPPRDSRRASTSTPRAAARAPGGPAA